MKKLLLSSLFAGATLVSFGVDYYYRTANTDTSWKTLENWTMDVEGQTPASAIPGKSGNPWLYFYAASDGTNTVIDSSEGNLGFERIYSGGSNSTLQISGANVNVTNRFELSNVAGTADNYTSFNLNITDGSSVKTWLYFGTKASFVETNLTISGNSSFTATSTTWNQCQVVNSADSKATWNIEKGSSFTTGANFAVNGTHGSSARSDVVVNVKGSVNSAGIFVGDGSNSKGVVNIYGSADYVSTSGVELKNKNSVLNLIMQDVAETKISHVTGGNIDVVNDSILTATKFSNTTGVINLDLENFYIEDDFSYIAGDTYAISLVSVSDLESLLAIDKINVLNADKMGSEWKLASEDKSEYLKWTDTTLYLYVTSSAIPEPSTYAAIFGALALAFAAYRRRK